MKRKKRKSYKKNKKKTYKKKTYKRSNKRNKRYNKIRGRGDDFTITEGQIVTPIRTPGAQTLSNDFTITEGQIVTPIRTPGAQTLETIIYGNNVTGHPRIM